MKGTVTSWNEHFCSGFITGDDGEEYFLHKDEVLNSKNIRKSHRFEFDTRDDGKNRLRAINVRKIAYGTSHPFYHDLKRVYDFVEQTDTDATEKGYMLRDIQMIMNYFTEIEDIEQFTDVRKRFRPTNIEIPKN